MKTITLIEQFHDSTSYNGEVYVYLIETNKKKYVVYVYDNLNGYVNFYKTLNDLLSREYHNNPDINFRCITKDEYDNDDIFNEWIVLFCKTELN